MKKRIFALFMVLTLLAGVLVLPASAAEGDTGEFTPEGASYKLVYKELADGTLCITDSSGECKGELILPEKIDGKTVTVIGRNAFSKDCDFTGSLIIPEGVTAIGFCAFSGCSGFSGDIVLPASLTVIENGAFDEIGGERFTVEEGNSAFCAKDGILMTKDGKTVIACPIGKTGPLVIPEGVTEISCSAFAHCTGLTGKLTLPESLTTIQPLAFAACSGLTGELILPEGLKDICQSAFADCTGFTGSLRIPDSVKKLLDNAFMGCTGFDGTLSLPDGLEYIAPQAFEGCSGFRGDLTIPCNVGASAFYDCTGFDGTLTLKEGVEFVGETAFYECTGFAKVATLPNSLTTTEMLAFTGCSGFPKTLRIPDSMTSFNASAFEHVGCDRYAVGDKNTAFCTVDGYLFSKDRKTFVDCLPPGNGELVIPEGTEIIGRGAFADCTGFTGTLKIPDSVTEIGSAAFSGCTGFTGTLTIPDHVTRIGDGAFSDCTGFTGALTIPDSVTRIEQLAFMNCSGFTGLTLGSGLEDIGKLAFLNCTGLTGTVAIPDSVTAVGDHAFINCGCEAFAVTDKNTACCAVDGMLLSKDGTVLIACPAGKTGPAAIPETVTTISAGAFLDCAGLTGELVISDKVTSIEQAAFGGCGVDRLAVSDKNENYSAGDGILLSKDGTVLLACPAGKTGTFRIPDSVTGIGNYAFYRCRGITGDLVIPDRITFVGDGAFAGIGCDQFVVSDKNEKFCVVDGMLLGKDASRLISCPAGKTGTVTIPATVDVINGAAFCDCTGLTDLFFLSEDLPIFSMGCFYGVKATGWHDPGWNEDTLRMSTGETGITWKRLCTGEHELVHHDGKPATCTEAGWKPYDTCKNCDYTTYEEIPALGHDWNAPTYEWSKDNKACTAKRVCKRDKTHVETAEAVITEKGGILTAVFSADWAAAQTKKNLPDIDASEKFIDVPENAWYREEVSFAVSRGLFGGTGENTFEPETPMTRAMLVTVLWRYEGQPEAEKSTFTDVDRGPQGWYKDAVDWAAANKIVGGVGENRFDPNGNVTREQMAAILYRYVGGKGIDTSKRGDVSGFPDGDKISRAWALEPMQWAVGEKLIGGSDGKLLPQGNATRAQVATILMRFIQNIVEK